MKQTRALKQVKIIYTLTTLFLMGLSIYTYVQIKNFGKSGELVSHSNQISLELEKLVGCMKDAETGVRGYLLTHDSSFLQPFYEALNEYPQHQLLLQTLTVDNSTQQNHLIKIKQLANSKKRYMFKILEIDKIRKPSNNEILFGKAVMDSLHQKINTMNTLENKLLQMRTKKYYKISYLTPLFIIVLFLGALLILFASYYRLNKEMSQSKKLHKTIKEIVMEARAGVCMLRGPNHYIELANNNYLGICSHKDICYKYMRDTLPELKKTGLFNLLDKVYKTGVTIEKKEVRLKFNDHNGKVEDRLYNITYKATHNDDYVVDGIVINIIEITEIYNSHNKIKANEEQLQIAINGGELGTFDFYTESRQLIWSDKTKQMFGLNPADEITYELYEQARNLPQNQALKNAIQIVDKNGHYETEYLVKGINDGVLRWLRSKGKATLNAEHKPIRFTGIVQDISKYKFAEQAISESEERFRNLAQALPQLVWVTNEKGISEFASNRWEEYSGIKPGGAKEWEAIVHPDDLNGINNAWMNSLSTGQIYKYDVRLKRKDGKYLWHSVIGEPIYNNQKEIIKWIGAFMDVDDEKHQSEIIKENEQKLQIVIEGSELGTWESNFKTDVISYSPRLLEIIGYKPNALVTKTDLTNQIHPEDNDIRMNAYNIAFETGVLNYQCRIVLPNNTIRWVETKGVFIKDSNNQPEKMIGTLRDITEEKNYTEDLAESEQKFRLLADSMPQHIWTADIKGNLNYFNQSVFDYSGLTVDQINKEGWIQIVHPDDREENIKVWLECVTAGKDFLFEHRFRKHTGEYRWQLSRAIPQKNSAGEIQMWVGTSTDIQDQKDFTNKLEKEVQNRTNELVNKNIELQKANDELELFAHISSHDLQEPLRKVQMSISRIADKDFVNLSDKGKEHFKRVVDAALTMQNLIEDLQTYSRSNNKDGNFEITDLNLILQETINELQERIDEKQAIINSSDLCEVPVIQFEIKQLFHNLIGNALKFSKPDTTPQITINSISAYGKNLGNKDLVADKKYCNISIADNGIGFEPQYSEKIFEVFQRLHGKDKYKGTGIGLAIVKKIVENHGGIITAKGELNMGATFEIYLPTHKMDAV